MARNDVEQTQTSSEGFSALRRELEGKIDGLEKKLDPKIESKFPTWAWYILGPILIAAIGGAYSTLNTDIKQLYEKVHALETALAVTNQKMDDSKDRH